MQLGGTVATFACAGLKKVSRGKVIARGMPEKVLTWLCRSIQSRDMGF
jgi:hypothetical protein